jgi:hypothetical protein
MRVRKNLNFDDKYKSYQEKTYQTHAPNMGRLEETICKVVRSNNCKSYFKLPLKVIGHEDYMLDEQLGR